LPRRDYSQINIPWAVRADIIETPPKNISISLR